MQPSFVWVDVAGEKKTDVLNEAVICTMSAAKVCPPRSCSFLPSLSLSQPCELSIQLLNSLRELLRTVCSDGSEGTDERAPTSRTASGNQQVPLPLSLLSLPPSLSLLLTSLCSADAH
jgi:hypothetical protein